MDESWFSYIAGNIVYTNCLKEKSSGRLTCQVHLVCSYDQIVLVTVVVHLKNRWSQL